ncbi:MAG: DUF2589 domain-containing protein [Treponema sp.]|jgi:hypothetical protein|nr:DUF2589 domain-containing protein [Treponema sp.]
MPDHAKELSSLDFSSIIGGALNAVITAQAQSARTSVDFIRDVGFNRPAEGNNPGEPVYVSFKYPREVTPAGGEGTAIYQDMEIKIPILTILPIPFIRVANAEIDLNVKINSINTTESSEEDSKSASVDVSAGWKGFGASVNVKLNASISHQKKTSSSEKVEREYSLHINVKAVQDELPAGMERLLDILEDCIQTRPLEGSGEKKAA